MIAELLFLGLWLSAPAKEDPVGNWNLTLHVGHRGEGLRTVVLEVTEEDEDYIGRITSMQNRMVDADEVTFDGATLTVLYGSYRYELKLEGDTAEGTVSSPAGTQEVQAKRQKTQLFAGDSPGVYQKVWHGRVEKREGGYVVVTRTNTFEFTNADAFRDELSGFVGQEVALTGLWRVDRVEIQKIESPRN